MNTKLYLIILISVAFVTTFLIEFTTYGQALSYTNVLSRMAMVACAGALSIAIRDYRKAKKEQQK